MVRSFLIPILYCLSSGTTFGAERIALVIGNAQYQTLRNLPNPVNDAIAVASELQALNFKLVGNRAHSNVSKAQMSTLLLDFQQQLKPDDLALFFYAGHGAAHEGRNFLLTVDDAGLTWHEQLPHSLLSISSRRFRAVEAG